MKERQAALLNTIVDEYIKSAQPVASGFLVQKLDEQVSSATVRNEMVALEKDGFIVQPHTSAGRVPTEKGYQFFVRHSVKHTSLTTKTRDRFNQALASADGREAWKSLAKQVADYTGETAIVAFAPNDIYYTGLSNLFAKPEFSDRNLVVEMSRVIDHLDRVIYNLFEDVDSPEIRIGSQCPFSAECSAAVTAFSGGLFTVLGPMRMDYRKNYNVSHFIHTL